jgi:glucan phosphoethanolaminetransferase (alkaline phosphatase superfamily)
MNWWCLMNYQCDQLVEREDNRKMAMIVAMCCIVLCTSLFLASCGDVPDSQAPALGFSVVQNSGRHYYCLVYNYSGNGGTMIGDYTTATEAETVCNKIKAIAEAKNTGK